MFSGRADRLSRTLKMARTRLDFLAGPEAADLAAQSTVH